MQPYRLHVQYRDGTEILKHDPYYFAPQLSDFDLHLFGEGNHHSIYASWVRTRKCAMGSPA